MNSYEIAFLNSLESDNKIKALINRLQKIFMLISGDKKDYSKQVAPSRLFSEENVYLTLLGNKINKNIQFDYSDSSLNFEFNTVVYKLYYLYDIDKFSYFNYKYETYSPIRKSDINVKLYVIGNPNNGNKFIDLMSCLGFELLLDYISVSESEYLAYVNFECCNSGTLRKFIDYAIILFRTLDGMFDLKFDDFDHIYKSIADNLGSDIEPLRLAYEYAITSDAGFNEYVEMVEKSLIKYQFCDFDAYYDSVISINEED